MDFLKSFMPKKDKKTKDSQSSSHEKEAPKEEDDDDSVEKGTDIDTDTDTDTEDHSKDKEITEPSKTQESKLQERDSKDASSSEQELENKDKLSQSSQESTSINKPNPIGFGARNHPIKSREKVMIFSGEVRSPNNGQLSFRISGFISKMNFKSGEFVKSGQVIAEIDKVYPLINKNMAKADLDKAKINLEQSSRDYKRSQKLKNKKAISIESYEKSQTEFKNNEVALKEAELKFKEMENKYLDTELKAPYSGIIIDKSKSEGEYVNPGEPILEFFENTDLEVDIYLPESYLNKVQIGDKVPLYIPSSQKKTTMKIKRIVPYVSKETRTFKIVGGVVSRDEALLSPGLFVEAHFTR